MASFARRIVAAWHRNGPADFARLLASNLRLVVSRQSRRFQYLHDSRFDREMNVDTSGMVHVDSFDVPEPLKAFAIQYEPSPVEVFEIMLSATNIANYGDFQFVDIGSGKGRVVFLAAMRNFRRVVGVEFSPEMHAVALANLSSFQASYKHSSRIDFVHGDGSSYNFDYLPTICYLNNPFNRALLEKLVNSIEDSLNECWRPFYVLYFHSFHASCFKKERGWRVITKGEYISIHMPYVVLRYHSPAVEAV